jgi:hypothetical protein
MAFVPGLLLLPAAVLTFNGNLGARARVDASTGLGGLDLIATPSVSLGLNERTWQVMLTTATYAAYINAFDPAQGTPNISQSLTANLTKSFRKMSFTLSETGQIGRVNLRLAGLSLGGGVAGPTGPVLPPTGAGSTANGVLLDDDIWYGSSLVSFTATETPSRTVAFHQFVRGSISTGLSEEDSAYPRQYGTGAGMGFSYKLSARDSLTTQLFTERIKPQRSLAIYFAGVTQSISHTFSGRVTGTAALGLSYSFPESSASRIEPTLFPTVNLGVNIDESPITFSVTLTPVIDQFTGTLDPRVFGQAQYTGKANQFSWFVSAGAGTSVGLTNNAGFITTTLNTGLQHPLTRDLSVGGSAGVSYQIVSAASQDSLIFFGLANLSYTPPGLRL